MYSLSSLTAKTKTHKVLNRDLLFADDVALAAHTEEQLQSLMDGFSRTCQDFSLNISLKKTNVLDQGVEQPPTITINNYDLEVVHDFIYLGSTVTDSLSLDAEISRRIRRAAMIFARLTKRAWENSKLTIQTNVAIS